MDKKIKFCEDLGLVNDIDLDELYEQSAKLPYGNLHQNTINFTCASCRHEYETIFPSEEMAKFYEAAPSIMRDLISAIRHLQYRIEREREGDNAKS